MKGPRKLLGLSFGLAMVAAACGGSATVASTSPAASSPAAASSALGKPSAAASSGPASGTAASGAASGSAAGSAAAKPSGAASGPASAAAPASASGSAAAAASGNPIKIGDIVPLTGVQAILGTDNRDGTNLYLDSINNTVAGRKIDVTYSDDSADATVGLTKAKELVENQKVNLLMGFNATPVCYAVSTYVQQAQIPMMVTANCAAQDILLDPKYKSQYVSRWTINNGGGFAPPGDWLYKQGYRKLSVFAADFGAGHEFADIISAAFVEDGGSVVQIQYPKVGTTDYSPVIAQLDPSADIVATFLPGIDGLRFYQAYQSPGAKHPPAFDTTNSATAGQPLDQLKDLAVGVKGSNIYTPAIDSQMNQTFLKQFATKFPGRSVSSTVANGYASAQVLVAALQKVNGNIEDKQAFLNALYATDMETIKGQLKLDQNHDIIENDYIVQVVKNPDGTYGHKLLDTYKGTTELWNFTPDQITKLQIGKDAIKWTQTDKTKLDQLLKG